MDDAIAKATPRGDSDWVIAKYDDLTAEETKLPDAWLSRVYHCNRLQPPDSAEKIVTARKKLWAMVFSNKWTTNSPIPKPGSIVERKAVDSTVKIGVLNEDAQTSKKRKADGTMVGVPAWRARGADVFIKVNVKWQRLDLTFPLCDSRGSTFATDIDFTPIPGSSLPQQKGYCTSRWDRAEPRRLGRVNTDFVVYWTRNALLFSLKNKLNGRMSRNADLPGAQNPAAIAGQPILPIDETPVDLSKLTHIQLCNDV